MFVRTHANSYSVTSGDEFGALRALVVYFDLPAVDCINGERACFVEARCPKPFIESYFHELLRHCENGAGTRCTFSRMIKMRELLALVVLAPFSAKSQVQPQKTDS